MNATEAAIEELASKDGVVRERARKALVSANSHEVVHALIAELVDPRNQVRWEAAKALSEIADPVAAIPLVHAMHDENSDVAWVASEGIAAMGEPGLLAVLSGLTRVASTVVVRHHHDGNRVCRDVVALGGGDCCGASDRRSDVRCRRRASDTCLSNAER